MNDKPVEFSMQRARPIRRPGIEDKPEPVMVQEPPKRRLRKQVSEGDGAAQGGEPTVDAIPPDSTEGRTEVSDQPSIPLADVLTLAHMPKTMELIRLFTSLSRDEARYGLHLIHKMFPELFQ